MNKRGILVVSFGTTYSDTREKTIEAIERELKEQFSDRTFYRAGDREGSSAGVGGFGAGV